MGSEGLLGALGGMFCGVLLGLLVAVALKLIRRRAILPGWPILLFAFLGGMLPGLLQHLRYS